MPLAEVTGGFQVFSLAEGDEGLAVRAGNSPTEVLDRKLDMAATGGTRQLERFAVCGSGSGMFPKPKGGATAGQQQRRADAFKEVGDTQRGA